MAKLGWRVRSLAWVLDHAPGGTVASMTPEQMLRTQQRLAGHARLTVGVTGGLAKGVSTENRVISQDGEQVPVRIYRAAAPDDAIAAPVIINFHGGGWALGALDQSDWLCSQVCLGVGAVVVSVDYRLAPTHQFPTAVLDSIAAVNWVAGNADELAIDANRIAVMGDSAGGNLAAVVCQLLRDRGGPAIVHQALLYPATDLRTPDDFDPDHPALADWPILSSASMVAFRDHYLGPDGDPTDPMASPILAADLSGLPPALVQVAEYDPLRDDGIRYARAMQEAGTPVRLTEYVGMPHGYFSFPKVIRGSIVQALAELCAEQRYALHGVPKLNRTVPVPPARAAEIPVETTTLDPSAARPAVARAAGSHPTPQHSAELTGQ
ncbi:MAG: alpha/beta hydrolase [Nakamurella sp.]